MNEAAWRVADKDNGEYNAREIHACMSTSFYLIKTFLSIGTMNLISIFSLVAFEKRQINLRLIYFFFF